MRVVLAGRPAKLFNTDERNRQHRNDVVCDTARNVWYINRSDIFKVKQKRRLTRKNVIVEPPSSVP